MIAVKGMTMPKNCIMCPLSYWANHWTFLGCNIGGRRYAMADKDYRESNERPKWCPLVEVANMSSKLIAKICLSDEQMEEIREIKKQIEELRRIKGKWIDNTCSNCGYTSILNPYALVERDGHIKEVLSQKFCPNCGADMRGEK